jgi:hypothetical protein
LANSRVVILKDIVSQVVSSINDLTKQQVLVGFPESTDERQDPQGSEPVTNAYLGYIHEFGSPDQNIPARPFLIPGVEATTPQSTERLKDAADYALSGKKSMAQRRLEEAGIIAAGGAKRAITNGDFVPLKPGTIARRAASRNTQSMRPEEKQYFKLLDQGVSEADAEAIAGIKPLINTGQLRNAITSVVRKK